MRRAMFVALGIGAIVSSAAAIGITATLPQGPRSADSLTFSEIKIAEASARAAQRSRIEARYRAERSQCEALSGLRHDRCLIAAHARHGHALLEAAAPYQRRS
jgi:hypothetical protein